ncbi:MAG: flagellar hook basal-body protein [Planctomycetota bacterium]
MMHYGIHLAASGALTNLYKQDVLANNLANVNTVGFKPDIVTIQSRDPARREDNLGHLPSNALIERLGGGLHPARNRIGLSQGPLETTHNPLDLAIEGDGFFMVEERGADGGSFLRLTRDGRFTLNNEGLLVMSTTGLPVLDDSGRQIELSTDAGVSIGGDGVITQLGESVARLALTDVPDRGRLTKHRAGLLSAPNDAISSRFDASGRIRQGHLEQSGVNEIATLMGVTGAGRAASGNLAVIGYHDRMMDQAINRLGRINA